MKPYRLSNLVLWVVVGTQAACWAADSRWTPPTLQIAPVLLPRLAQPLVLDGELKEWASAVHVPMFERRHILAIRSGHKRLGPADASAVIQWNHPGFPDSDFQRAQMPIGLRGTALDAWEHIPSTYDEWKAAGVLPVITGTTDTHDGTFSYLERTVVLAPSPAGDDVAEAIRCSQAAAVQPEGRHVLYGSDEMASAVWAAIAEGSALRAAKARRLADALVKADLAGILAASEPRVVKRRARAGVR